MGEQYKKLLYMSNSVGGDKKKLKVKKAQGRRSMMMICGRNQVQLPRFIVQTESFF